MSAWHGGKGSSRRREDAAAIEANWPWKQPSDGREPLGFAGECPVVHPKTPAVEAPGSRVAGEITLPQGDSTLLANLLAPLLDRVEALLRKRGLLPW